MCPAQQLLTQRVEYLYSDKKQRRYGRHGELLLIVRQNNLLFSGDGFLREEIDRDCH